MYACSCVDLSDGSLIHKMVDAAQDVTYATMLRQCRGLLEWAEQKGYVRNKSQGLTLADDWSVSFHRSRFQNQPCYYVRWSSIEFIWVKET